MVCFLPCARFFTVPPKNATYRAHRHVATGSSPPSPPNMGNEPPKATELTLHSGERISIKGSVWQKVSQAFQAAFFIHELEFERFWLCLEVGYAPADFVDITAVRATIAVIPARG